MGREGGVGGSFFWFLTFLSLERRMRVLIKRRERERQVSV